MNKVLAVIILMAASYLNARAQITEGIFNKMEVSRAGSAVRFDFINDGKTASIFLTNRVDSLKTRISGDFIRNKYVLKEESGVKTLYIYLPPKWNYGGVKGIGFGKAYLSRQRIQGQRNCL